MHRLRHNQPRETKPREVEILNKSYQPSKAELEEDLKVDTALEERSRLCANRSKSARFTARNDGISAFSYIAPNPNCRAKAPQPASGRFVDASNWFEFFRVSRASTSMPEQAGFFTIPVSAPLDLPLIEFFPPFGYGKLKLNPPLIIKVHGQRHQG